MPKGFTLIELVMVMVVIGILVAVAIPQFTISVERSRAAEGVAILGAVRSAQLRYYVENGAYASSNCLIRSSATNCGLDIGISQTQFFREPSTGNSDASQLGIIARKPNPSFGIYQLSINESGAITCSGGAGGICTKLGY